MIILRRNTIIGWVLAMKPDFKIVARDETEYWEISDYPEIKKIWTVYFTNFSEPVHCCEMTPSYCLTPVSFFIEYTEEFETELNETRYSGEMNLTKRKFQDIEYRLEEIEDMVRSNQDYDPIYIHCHSVKEGSHLKLSDFPLNSECEKAIEEGTGPTEDELNQFFYEALTCNTQVWIDTSGKLQF